MSLEFAQSASCGFVIDTYSQLSANYSRTKPHAGLFSLSAPYLGKRKAESINQGSTKKRKIEPTKETNSPAPFIVSAHKELTTFFHPSQEVLDESRFKICNDEDQLMTWQVVAQSMLSFSDETDYDLMDVSELEEISDPTQVWNQMIYNKIERPLTIMGFPYILPSNCSFLLSDFSFMQPLVTNCPKNGYQIIVMDPPWDSKSVNRSQQYDFLHHSKLSQIPIGELCNNNGAFIVVWVTNNPKFQTFITKELFKKWKVQYCQTWHWLKVTNEYEMVLPIDSTHRKPYEPIIIGYRPPIQQDQVDPVHLDEVPSPTLLQPVKTEAVAPVIPEKVIISIPGAHSSKPNLGEVLIHELGKYIDPNPNCLELFARNLYPGWTSWGNQVLNFQQEKYFKLVVEDPVQVQLGDVTVETKQED